MNKMPVIIGPTAGGKTALAVRVARKLGRAEIVSADSMLIYRGLNIGAAKPTAEEMGGVPHHGIDVIAPTDTFSVQQWLSLATAAIADIRARGAEPVIVGGTHLYIKALLDGLFDGPGADESIRARLRALPREQLRAMLESADPPAALKLHPNDLRRTVRALEVFELTGKRISDHQRQWDTDKPESEFVLINIDWPTDQINRRINARVKGMFEQGLVQEARALHDAGLLGTQAKEALGYKQLIAHFRGRCTLEDAAEQIKIETRRFAKNQRTWARRLRVVPGAITISAAETPEDSWADIVVRACSSGP